MANIIPGVTTAQQAADIVNLDRAKVGGDSSQDFTAKELRVPGFEGALQLKKGNGDSATIDIVTSIIKSHYSVGFTSQYANGGADIIQLMINTRNGNVISRGNVTASSFTPFTGCHIIPNEGQNFKISELICIEAKESEDKKQPDWRGRYAKKGEQGIFGIVFDEYEESKPIPEIGVNKFYSVACLGDDKVYCNNENGNIKYGDELCASSKSGVAMKFTGGWKDRKQICGKAGRSHTFESDEVVLIDTAKE